MQQVRQKRFLNLFTVFSDSVKRQVNENKQFQSNLKQIQDSNKALQESDTLKHARAAMQARFVPFFNHVCFPLFNLEPSVTFHLSTR